jgi:hypothetical protein
MTLEEAKNMYQMYKQRYDDIIKRYGTGVRPSWVSTDLAIEGERMRHYAKLVEELESNVKISE